MCWERLGQAGAMQAVCQLYEQPVSGVGCPGEEKVGEVTLNAYKTTKHLHHISQLPLKTIAKAKVCTLTLDWLQQAIP